MIINVLTRVSTQFDVVVLGTGMVESIVAAAAARQGHSVLHLDNARYYGGQSQDCVTSLIILFLR